jgi:hypothetical protein
LRYIYKRAMRLVRGPWFAIAMHGEDTFGDQLFVCPLDNLFGVLRAIAEDSPEFRHRLALAARLANGNASVPVVPVELEVPTERRNDPEPLVDDSTAVWIE